MSNFICERCGVTQVDSDRGYVAGCAHYPPDHKRMVTAHFGGDHPTAQAFHDGAWYKTAKAKAQGRAIHPISWEERQ
jgi:hypothetical protein